MKAAKAVLTFLLLLLAACSHAATSSELGEGAALESCDRFDRASRGLKVEEDPVLNDPGYSLLQQAEAWASRAKAHDSRWAELNSVMGELETRTPVVAGIAIFNGNDEAWDSSLRDVEEVCGPLLSSAG